MEDINTLTPIRVRRKNTQQRPSRAEQRRRPSVLQNQDSDPPRPSVKHQGRPLKLTPALLPTTSANCLSLRRNVAAMKSSTAQSTTPPRRSSLLEGLPTEILQRIFLLSMNANLPLALPLLATTLSSKHVYISFCLRAFEKAYYDLGSAESRSLWATILSRKWMVLELWEQFEGNVYTRHMIDENDYLFAFLFPLFHPPMTLPTKLLHRPFTVDKVIFLDQLIQNGAEVDPINTTDMETANEGLRHAIMDGSAFAVEVLSQSALYTRVDQEMLRMVVIDARCNRGMIRSLVGMHSESRGKIDARDPELWAWASAQEKCQEGRYVVDLLKRLLTPA